jgi:hypothetical protein
LAVRLPFTWSEPVTGAVEQLRLTAVGSSVPLTVRHDDTTFQVPTTLPPQVFPFEQDAGPPPAPVLPPVPVVCPPLPPVPPVFEVELPHAITVTDNQAAKRSRRAAPAEARTGLAILPICREHHELVSAK